LNAALQCHEHRRAAQDAEGERLLAPIGSDSRGPPHSAERCRKNAGDEVRIDKRSQIEEENAIFVCCRELRRVGDPVQRTRA